ncbi:MAG: DUF5989 family protein [Planctomycetota bacterium]|jgi:hypothetical protein
MSSFRQFLAENKTWWIVPIVIVLAIVGYILVSDQPEGIAGEDSPFDYSEY